MKEKKIWLVLVGLTAAAWLCSCGAANRALLHPDDQKKVFPWPEGQQSASVRVKPLSGKVKVFPFTGDWQNVEVTPDTTFFITEETGGEFAYTPSRSPIRRLAPVEKIQIRWPLPASTVSAPATESAAPAEPGKTESEKPSAEKPVTEKPAAGSEK